MNDDSESRNVSLTLYIFLAHCRRGIIGQLDMNPQEGLKLFHQISNDSFIGSCFPLRRDTAGD